MRKTNRRCLAFVLLTGSVLAAPVCAAPYTIGFNGAVPPLNKVKVESGNVYDYTFTAAPVDWRVQSGTWAMTNRWSSAPQWSWYGGRSWEIAAIWNKRKFSGDFSVQVYFAFKEGLHGSNSAWKERPSDIAISFCGDGKNLGSGYSLIFGADGNRHTILQKQGAGVAESSASTALFASDIDGRRDRIGWNGAAFGTETGGAATTATASGKFSGVRTAFTYAQSDWRSDRRYVKVNKIGNRIECWLESKLLFVYDDPQPLDIGQIALWTFNNGIVLSRVQIFYENEVKNVFLPPNAVENTVAVAEPLVPVAHNALR